MLISQLCTYASLTSPELTYWAGQLRPMWDPDGTDPKPFLVHRKMWEWLFVCQALAERDMLRPGRRGLGFGVGREPLVALFAGRGCQLVATDLDPAHAHAAGWTEAGGEYAGDRAVLNQYGFCPPDAFDERVAYRYLDMTALPEDLGRFDFTWSSCAFEHLGDLAAGLRFIEAQLDYLAPGGVAVHTTELNVSSDDRTVEAGPTVLYRRRDVAQLVARLRDAGYRIRCDLRDGDTPADRHVDRPPFTDTHLRVGFDEFVTTSLGLIVEKPAP